MSDLESNLEPSPLSAPKRIGMHLSTAGGVFTAAERAHAMGANTFQIFSSSPRMWRPAKIAPDHCARMKTLRADYDCAPLAIHASYLINLCSQTEEVRRNSIAAFRAELERALALGAEYLVLHPGSWKGLTREQGLELAAQSIQDAIAGLAPEPARALASAECGFRILIENTAGAEFSLGGAFDQVAELLARLAAIAPLGVCLDTCHTHVAGYDLVTPQGYEATIAQIDALIGLDRVRLWHMNDAKAPLGSRLDRHEHIGEGTIGREPFRRLLNDPRFAHCAFIAETPVDEEGDQERDLLALKSLAARKVPI
jgi:deoxyribonuclease-4